MSSKKSNRRGTPAAHKSQDVSHPEKQTTFLAGRQQTTISGPIPSASEMERYHSIDPMLADRIVSLAEREADHRHRNDDAMLRANIEITNKQFLERRIGQFLGFGIAIAGLSCCIALAWMGYQTAASVVGGATVVGLVGIFVTGQVMAKKQDE